MHALVWGAGGGGGGVKEGEWTYASGESVAEVLWDITVEHLEFGGGVDGGEDVGDYAGGLERGADLGGAGCGDAYCWAY